MSKLNEILDFNTDETNGAFPQGLRDYYKAEIQALISECVPENRTDTYIEREIGRLEAQKGTMTEGERRHSAIGKAIGYNQAIADMLLALEGRGL